MNIVLGRQLRAARVLAGLTQRQLSTEAGFNPRACRYWERRGNKLPTHTPATLKTIEQVLRRHGVEGIFYSDTGARLI
jgi:transcriptional regulator with XRE-family HTH domain